MAAYGNHLIEYKNISHYHLVNLTGSQYNTECYLKVDLRSTLDNSTDYVYSSGLSTFGGLVCCFESLVGSFLNLIVMLSLSTDPKLRKEYLFTPVMSLVATDYAYSLTTLPILALRFFVQ